MLLFFTKISTPELENFFLSLDLVNNHYDVCKLFLNLENLKLIDLSNLKKIVVTVFIIIIYIVPCVF